MAVARGAPAREKKPGQAPPRAPLTHSRPRAVAPRLLARGLRAHPPSLRLALASPTRAKTPQPRMVFSKAWFASKVRGFVGDSQMDEEMFKRTFVCCLLVYFISLVVRGFIRAAGAKRTRVGAGTVAELRNR